MSLFKRASDLLGGKNSAFLFGPRMTGKTTLLRQLQADAYYDLLDVELEIALRANPGRLKEELLALPEGATVIIDEIQRIPELLNYVQMGIDRRNQVFLLSGSSARKLRRGGANLLGGRALDLKLHPLTCEEMQESFSMPDALMYGTLPRIAALLRDGSRGLVPRLLSGYVTTYIKEEIQAEALTRNIGAFQRFLSVAGQSNGQIIEFSNISRDCAVPASTVKEYYQILEDTLIGSFLWPYGHNERKKARPKFYFFDCGVIRALQSRLHDPPTPNEKGFLFETWLVNELVRIRDYSNKPHTFSHWRERDKEIDILVQQGTAVPLAIECKSGTTDLKANTVKRFREKFPGTRLIVASLTDERPRTAGDVEILPWRNVLKIYRNI